MREGGRFPSEDQRKILSKDGVCEALDEAERDKLEGADRGG